MPVRRTAFVAGAHYHVFNRGVERRQIFPDDRCYLWFTTMLIRRMDKWSVGVVAYCLMPNHFHLLLRAEADATVSMFMQGVGTAYAQWFNHQLDRVGPVFAGRFRARQVSTEAQLVHTARYIHRNPLEAGLVSRLADWPYSDYPELLGVRPAKFRGRSLVPDRFATATTYQAFVEGGADFPEVPPLDFREVRP